MIFEGFQRQCKIDFQRVILSYSGIKIMKKISDIFEIGFWHPFGPHGGETPEQIINRKRKEISKNGWTLWSFQFRKTLKSWHQEIMKTKPNKVLVFCSNGNGARDPLGNRKNCNYYVPINTTDPKKIPASVKIPHPMGKKTKASAFIIKNIISPIQNEPIKIGWLKNGKWQTNKLPTRPEYLIKAGKGQPMRKFRAILELQYPYLAEVGLNSDFKKNEKI